MDPYPHKRTPKIKKGSGRTRGADKGGGPIPVRTLLVYVAAAAAVVFLVLRLGVFRGPKPVLMIGTEIRDSLPVVVRAPALNAKAPPALVGDPRRYFAGGA